MDNKNTNKLPVLDILAKIASWFLRLLFPPKCVICKDLLLKDGELCPECMEIWAKARNMRCPICQKTARGCRCSTFHLLNTDMLGGRKLSALAFYGKFGSDDIRDILVRRLVYAVKTSDDRSGVNFCARLLSHDIIKAMVLCGEEMSQWKITFPQRSLKRRKRYGFDHGRDLALKISKYTGIPFEETLKSNAKYTQKSLNAMERMENANSAYSLKKGVVPSGKYILVDDVITTGATVNAAARVLKSAGAKAVYPVCIARSKRKKKKIRRPNERPWFTAK